MNQFACGGGVIELENERIAVHIPAMATFVYCTCGVRYIRTETCLAGPDRGGISCQLCSVVLENWVGDLAPLYEILPSRRQGLHNPESRRDTPPLVFPDVGDL